MDLTITEKALPFSRGKYKLTRHSTIVDEFENEIETNLIDGKKFVTIDWVFGVTQYEVGFVIAIVHLSIKVPTIYWQRIEPIYLDGNPLNLSVENIIYRFKYGPIEVHDRPGYFYIPFFTNYAISRGGDLINVKNGHSHSWCTTKPVPSKNIKGGYKNTWATSDYRSLKNLNRHRAMGLTFLPYNENPFDYVINHKNGIPGDDVVDNLEWVTRAQNNQHAYDSGLINSANRVLMKNLETGEVETFNSFAACQRKINRSEAFIRVRVFKRSHVRYSDNLAFKLDDGKPWPILTEEAAAGTETRDIVARDIFTGNLYIFDSATKAAEYTKLTGSTVLKNAANEAIVPVNGFNFRFCDTQIVWPNHSEKHLRIYKMYPKEAPKGVLVTDLNGQELEFFESTEMAARAYNLSVGRISQLCRERKSINGSTFSFYMLEENLGPAIA